MCAFNNNYKTIIQNTLWLSLWVLGSISLAISLLMLMTHIGQLSFLNDKAPWLHHLAMQFIHQDMITVFGWSHVVLCVVSAWHVRAMFSQPALPSHPIRSRVIWILCIFLTCIAITATVFSIQAHEWLLLGIACATLLEIACLSLLNIDALKPKKDDDLVLLVINGD
jgi:hypothetical protein